MGGSHAIISRRCPHSNRPITAHHSHPPWSILRLYIRRANCRNRLSHRLLQESSHGLSPVLWDFLSPNHCQRSNIPIPNSSHPDCPSSHSPFPLRLSSRRHPRKLIMSAAFAISPQAATLPSTRPRGATAICQAVRVPRVARRGAHSVRASSSTPPPEMPEAARAAKARGDKVEYWQGEWICVDCGFIYKPARKVKFEDLPGSWKCPQCNAPKRRFAKKAGDMIAETSGTSNLPIIIFSIVGLLGTVAFGIWASTQL